MSELTSNFAIASIETVFIEPQTTFLELTTTFNFDPDLTSSTASSTADLIQTTINTYFANNLQKFGLVFRRSNLLTIIYDVDQ